MGNHDEYGKEEAEPVTACVRSPECSHTNTIALRISEAGDKDRLESCKVGSQNVTDGFRERAEENQRYLAQSDQKRLA